MAEMAKGAREGKARKGKLLLIVLPLLLLAAAGGAAAWWMLVHKAHPAHPAQAAAHPAPIEFITLAPFVTNLASSDGNAHYLQTTIALKTSDPKLSERIATVTPEIRNAVLRLLASQPADKAASVQVRDMLRTQILQAVNQVLGTGAGHPGPVGGVYFTTYVVQ